MAVAAVATAFSHKGDPVAHAQSLLERSPQVWAYGDALERLRHAGYKVTKERSVALWHALGGH